MANGEDGGSSLCCSSCSKSRYSLTLIHLPPLPPIPQLQQATKIWVDRVAQMFTDSVPEASEAAFLAASCTFRCAEGEPTLTPLDALPALAVRHLLEYLSLLSLPRSLLLFVGTVIGV